MKKVFFLLIVFFAFGGSISFAQGGEETPKVIAPKNTPFRTPPNLQPMPAGSTVPDDKDSQTNAPQNNQAQGLNQQTIENANDTSQPAGSTDQQKKKFKINFKKVADGVDIVIGVVIAGVAIFFMIVPTVKVLINQYS